MCLVTQDRKLEFAVSAVLKEQDEEKEEEGAASVLGKENER